MECKKIIIISNRLTEFANNKNVLTYDQFSYLLHNERKSIYQDKYQVYLGQGLNDFQISIILQEINESDLFDRFSLSGVLHQLHRAGNALTHKRKIENSMISSPKKISEALYKSYLMLDESCAEMQDHITGQHIQGMVLIEAARQMVNSVSEKFLISAEEDKKGFVLNTLNATFIDYVFPLDVEIIFHIKKLRQGLYGNFKAYAEIKIIQADQVAMLVAVDFSVMGKTTLLDLESQLAASVIQKTMINSNHNKMNQCAA